MHDHGTAPRLVEDDPLIRAAALEAAIRERQWVGRPVLCVGAHGLERVAACPLLGAPRSSETVVLYTLRDHLTARLHSLHGCADAYAVLVTRLGEAGREAPYAARFEFLSGPDPLVTAGITAREASVLALVLARWDDAEIARELVISVTTVRTHCRSILRKLGAHSRRDARERLLPR